MNSVKAYGVGLALTTVLGLGSAYLMLRSSEKNIKFRYSLMAGLLALGGEAYLINGIRRLPYERNIQK